MTWLDLVRVFWPDADDDTCDFVLWNLTPFPMGDHQSVVNCLEAWRGEYKTARNLRRYGFPRNERMVFAAMEKYANQEEPEHA